MDTKETPQSLIGKQVRITNPDRAAYGDVLIIETHNPVTDEYVAAFWGYKRHEFDVIDDLSRFKMYDAPVEIELPPFYEKWRNHCSFAWELGHTALGYELFIQSMNAPAIDIPVSIPAPLQRLEELEAENAELKFTLECANTVTNGYQKDACDLREKVEALEAENARLQRHIIELETINECQTEEIAERRKNIGRLNTVVMNTMMELDIFSGWFTTTYEENQVSIIEAIQALKKVESAA